MAPQGALSDGTISALQDLCLLDLNLRDTANYNTEFELIRELALQQGGTEENGQTVEDGTLRSFARGPLGKIYVFR